MGATRRFEVDEPTTERESEILCASRDASGNIDDIDDDSTDAVVGIGCVGASLDKSFEIEGEGEPRDVGLSMTIDGARNGAAGSGLDMMALPMSLISHRPTIKGVMFGLRERVI